MRFGPSMRPISRLSDHFARLLSQDSKVCRKQIDMNSEAQCKSAIVDSRSIGILKSAASNLASAIKKKIRPERKQTDEATGNPSGPASGTESARKAKEANSKTVTEREPPAGSEKAKGKQRRKTTSQESLRSKV